MLLTNTQWRFGAVVLDSVLGHSHTAHPPGRCPYISIAATNQAGLRRLRALQKSATETTEYLAGTKEKKFSWTRFWISYPGKSMIFNLSGLYLIFLDCLLPPWTDQPECWDTKEKCMHIAHQSNSTKMKACHDFSCSAMRECKTWCFCCRAFTCFIDHLLKLWKCKKTTQQWTLESWARAVLSSAIA